MTNERKKGETEEEKKIRKKKGNEEHRKRKKKNIKKKSCKNFSPRRAKRTYDLSLFFSSQSHQKAKIF